MLTKFSIHISPGWTWSHFTKQFLRSLEAMGGFPYYPIYHYHYHYHYHLTAIFAVLDATNCQDLSVQWDLPNTERISAGFHGTGNLKKGNAKKALFLQVLSLLKTCEKMTRRKHLVEIPVFVGCFRRLVVWPLRSSPSLWGSAFPSPRRAMRSSWSRPPWLSKSSSKNKLKWAMKKTFITFHWILVG